MATAREKLAAIRSWTTPPAGVAPAPTPEAPKKKEKKENRWLAASLAASEADPKMQEFELVRGGMERIVDTRTGRNASLGEATRALAVDAATGGADALGGTLGLVADASVDIMTAGPVRRGARAMLKQIRGERVTPEDWRPPTPVVDVANRAADDFRRAGREVTGTEHVDTGNIGEGIRLGVDIALPMPDLAAAGKRAAAGAREATAVVDVAEDAAQAVPRAADEVMALADDVPVEPAAVVDRRTLAERRVAERRKEIAERRGLPEDDELVQTAAEADIDLKTGVYSANAFKKAQGTEKAATAVDVAFLGKLNDSEIGRELGDAFGDEILSTMARVLDDVAGDGGRAYRRGGDEFTIMWNDAAKGDEMLPVVKQRLDEAIMQTRRLNGDVVEWQGIGHYIGHGKTADEASAAVNRAKPDKADYATRDPLFADYYRRITAGQRPSAAAGRSGVSGSAGADSVPQAGVAQWTEGGEPLTSFRKPEGEEAAFLQMHRSVEEGAPVNSALGQYQGEVNSAWENAQAPIPGGGTAAARLQQRLGITPEEADFMVANEGLLPEGSPSVARLQQEGLLDKFQQPTAALEAEYRRAGMAAAPRVSEMRIRDTDDVGGLPEEAGDVLPSSAGSKGGGAGEPPPPPKSPGTGPDDLEKYARPSAINLEQLNAPDEAKRFIRDTARAVDDPVGGDIAGELEAMKGEPLTHAEIQAARDRGRILTDVSTREETLALAADMLRSRDRLVEIAKEGRVTAEYLELQRAVSSRATELGRLLNSLAIKAGDDVSTAAIKEVTEQLEALGKTSDEIVQALDGVDFADPVQATAAYAKHIKPKWGDLLDAYRYTNLLSSPRTHIVNLTSNLLQAGITRPADLLMSGAVDWFGSKLSGKARSLYASDVTPYYRGMLSAFPKATEAFFDAMKGKSPIGHLDLARQASQAAVPAPLKVIPRLLEGIDQFTVKLIEAGEYERLASAATRRGGVFNEVEAATEAANTAKEYAFRKALDPDNKSGHGALLSTIDQFTMRASHLFNTRVGGTQPLRWAVPFIQTPMNILKSGIEHSPIGFATAYKSTRETEQIAKAMTGSAVFMGAGMLALDDRTTWSAPRNPKDRAAFYAAGFQPYAVKIGDTWASYTKLGPLAYPIALAAAMKYQAVDHPEATGQINVALAGRILGSLAEFFSDQSYMRGVGDIVNAARGEENVIASTITNFATQLVPFASLQRWVTQIIDPVYRKGDRKLTAEAIWQNIKRGIPGLSPSVPPQLTPSGEESRRQYPLINAVSPFGITTESDSGADNYKRIQAKRRSAAARRRERANR